MRCGRAHDLLVESWPRGNCTLTYGAAAKSGMHILTCIFLYVTCTQEVEWMWLHRWTLTPLLLAIVPNSKNSSGLGLEPEPYRGNGSYHKKTWTVVIGQVLPPIIRHFNFTIVAPIKVLSFDRIPTWSICRLCSFSRSFHSHFQICNTPSIPWVAIENPRISLKICP
jgi:hypothetical protein